MSCGKCSARSAGLARGMHGTSLVGNGPNDAVSQSPSRAQAASDIMRALARGMRHMGRILFLIASLAGLPAGAFGQTAPASEIAPGGKLRVGMIAITVLGGVAEPVARFIGQKLGATVEPVMYPSPDAYLQSFVKDK